MKLPFSIFLLYPSFLPMNSLPFNNGFLVLDTKHLPDDSPGLPISTMNVGIRPPKDDMLLIPLKELPPTPKLILIPQSHSQP